MEIIALLFSLIIMFLFFVCIFILPIVFISNLLKKSGKFIKNDSVSIGTYGEDLLKDELLKLDIGYNRILQNMYVFNSDTNKVTEIDMILLHATGIYVFESKNYSGWIFGKQFDDNWTQCLKGGKKVIFHNPVKQNFGHICSLKELLKINDDKKFVSYIVFSNRCELKKIPDETPKLKVLKRCNVYTNLKNTIEERPIVFNDMDIEKISSMICASNKQIERPSSQNNLSTS